MVPVQINVRQFILQAICSILKFFLDYQQYKVDLSASYFFLFVTSLLPFGGQLYLILY